jgi:uncharacterized protein YkwD
MPKRRATLAVAGLTLGCALPAAPAGATATRQDSTERSVVSKVNAIRARHGLRTLRRSTGLTRAADRKVREVVQTDALTHSSPDGTPMSSRVRKYVDARSIGETLGFVPRGSAQAARIVGEWMSSPSHRAALLSPAFRRVGVSRRTGHMAGGPVTVFALDLASAR